MSLSLLEQRRVHRLSAAELRCSPTKRLVQRQLYSQPVPEHMSDTHQSTCHRKSARSSAQALSAVEQALGLQH